MKTTDEAIMAIALGFFLALSAIAVSGCTEHDRSAVQSKSIRLAEYAGCLEVSTADAGDHVCAIAHDCGHGSIAMQCWERK